MQIIRTDIHGVKHARGLETCAKYFVEYKDIIYRPRCGR